MILVDSCVIIDVLVDDPNWAAWSQQQLENRSVNGALIVNPVIYAEISVGFERIERLESMLKRAQLGLQEIPREALFLAGKAFQRYRARGGTRSSTLLDFFIGAHATVSGIPLLTRDVARYTTYFPQLELIAPDNKR